MSGGLFDPLGQHRAEPAPRRPAAVILAGLALAALAALVAVAFLRDDGDRGRPLAVAPIAHVDAPPKAPQPPPPPPAAPDAGGAARDAASAPGLPPPRADQDVEVQNGVRIVRPRRSAPGAGSQTVPVPAAPTPR